MEFVGCLVTFGIDVQKENEEKGMNLEGQTYQEPKRQFTGMDAKDELLLVLTGSAEGCKAEILLATGCWEKSSKWPPLEMDLLLLELFGSSNPYSALLREADLQGKPFDLLSMDLIPPSGKPGVISILPGFDGRNQIDRLLCRWLPAYTTPTPISADGMWLSLPVPILMIDLGGRIVTMNIAAQKTFSEAGSIGSEGNGIGALLEDFLSELDPGATVEIISRAIVEGDFVLSQALTQKGSDKVHRQYELQAAPVTLEDGSRFVQICLKELKLMADKHRQISSLATEYANLFEHSAHAIMVVEPESGTIIDLNVKLTELTGYSKEELVGAKVDRLFREGRGKACVSFFKETFDTAALHESDWITKSGVLLPVELSCSKSLYSNTLTVALVFVKDATQSRKQQKTEAVRRELVDSLAEIHKAVVADADLVELALMVSNALSRISVQAGCALYVWAEGDPAMMAHRLQVTASDHLLSVFPERFPIEALIRLKNDSVQIFKNWDLASWHVQELCRSYFLNGTGGSGTEISNANLVFFVLPWNPSDGRQGILISAWDKHEEPVIQEFLRHFFLQLVLSVEKLEANRLLKDREARYRSLFEANLSGVYLTDMNDNILDCNDSFAKMFGFHSRLDIIGVNLNTFAFNQSFRGFGSRFKENDTLRGVESRLVLFRNGQVIWLMENATLVRDSNNNPVRVQGTVIDITRNKETESLIEDLARFPEENPNPVIRFSSSLDLMYRNEAALEFLGYFADDENRPLPQFQEILVTCMQENASKAFEISIGRKTYLLSLHWVAKQDYINLYANDITRRKQFELQQSVIYSISKLANSLHAGFGEVCGMIHRELGKVLDARNFFIAIYDDQLAEVSFPYFVDETLPGLNILPTRKNGKGLTEYVLGLGAPVMLLETDIESLIARGLVDAREVIPKVWIGSTLATKTKTLGLIAVQSYHDASVLGLDELELVKYASNVIAHLLQNVQYQEKLVKSETELRMLAENAPNIIMRVNRNFIIEYINKSVPELGLSQGKSIRSRIPKELWGDLQRKVAIVWRTRETETYEFRMVSLENETRWFSASLAAFPKDALKDSILVILDDITERKQSEINVLNALTDGQENERRRIAQELHDGLGQLLSVIKLNLLGINNRLENKLLLKPVIEAADSAILEYKAISHNLIPPSLKENGLIKALQDTCRQVQTMTGIEMELVLDGEGERIPANIEYQMFRIIQELISNAVRHSGASKINVGVFILDNSIICNVSDNGKGFDYSKIEGSEGIGLRNLRARAQMMGASVLIDSQVSEGTSVTIKSAF